MSKPFDLKAALAGDSVATHRGDPVTQIHRFGNDVDGQKVYGVVCGRIESWDDNGNYFGSPSSKEIQMDLQMATTKREGWLNIYDYPNNSANAIGGLYRTKWDADFACRQRKERVACIRVEWEQ